MREIVSIRVRSRDAAHVFKSLTRPTRTGASKLTCRRGRWMVPPTVMLLCEIMIEEFQSKVRVPDIDSEFWLEDGEEPPTGVRLRLPSIIDGMEMPAQAPVLSTEFTLILVERGPDMLAVFHALTV